jgi:hypothetical protein
MYDGEIGHDFTDTIGILMFPPTSFAVPAAGDARSETSNPKPGRGAWGKTLVCSSQSYFYRLDVGDLEPMRPIR